MNHRTYNQEGFEWTEFTRGDYGGLRARRLSDGAEEETTWEIVASERTFSARRLKIARGELKKKFSDSKRKS